MANEDIKQDMVNNHLKYWVVAEKYGCADTTFSRKLRHELPAAEKAKIRSIIAELSKGGETA